MPNGGPHNADGMMAYAELVRDLKSALADARKQITELKRERDQALKQLRDLKNAPQDPYDYDRILGR